MGDWEHKRSDYHTQTIQLGAYSDKEGHEEEFVILRGDKAKRLGTHYRITETQIIDGESTRETRIVSKEEYLKSNFLDQSIEFSEWLDFQCRDGWEVLDIRFVASTKKVNKLFGSVYNPGLERVIFRRRKNE